MTRFSDSDTFIYEIFRMAFAANKVLLSSYQVPVHDNATIGGAM